jgi:hypothetical protein
VGQALPPARWGRRFRLPTEGSKNHPRGAQRAYLWALFTGITGLTFLALRGLTLEALDCLNLLVFWTFWRLTRYVAGFFEADLVRVGRITRETAYAHGYRTDDLQRYLG